MTNVTIFCKCGLTIHLQIEPGEGFMFKCSKCGAIHMQTPKEGKGIRVWKDRVKP